MKVLVAIANHGTKNRHFLDRLLESYRSMPYRMTIVVLSDKPKTDLPSDVEVLVGAPTPNPRSLPFAHRLLFAERANDYDLFVYTEDDTLIEQRHIEAFLSLNELLPDDEIPGFMRYEVRPSGERSYCSVHSHYRWDTRTVAVRGDAILASFTNQHSACHIMTREQLRKAIDSGGFLVAPHEGVYGMLESAATDPYTRCGFKRRVAISRIEDFLLHHLPNIYLDKLGISPEDFFAQLEALEEIARGRASGSALIDPELKLPAQWGLQCYPRASAELRSCVPPNARTVLTVGSTAGILERELFGDSAAIVGIPVDNALAAVARRRNMELTEPEWYRAMQQLQGRSFDVVLLHDVLHRFADPVRVLKDLVPLLARKDDARMLISMANLWPYRLRNLVRVRPGELPRSFAESGMHRPTWSNVRRWLSASGLEPEMRAFRADGKLAEIADRLPSISRAWLAEELIVRARRA